MPGNNKLTPKQEAFAQAYALCGVGAQAYRQAYNVKTASNQVVAECASRLLHTPKIASRIAELQARTAAIAQHKFDITAERIAEELAALAFFNPADLYDDDGRMIPIKQLPKHVVIALQKIEHYEDYAGQGEDRKATGVLRKAVWHDKRAALETLGKWHQIRMWVTQTETGGAGEFGLPRRPEEAREVLDRIRREAAMRRLPAKAKG
jgi:phage terminase small subunit